MKRKKTHKKKLTAVSVILIILALIIAAIAGFIIILNSPVNPDSFETLELDDGTLYIADYIGLPRRNFVFPSEINEKKVTIINSCFHFSWNNEALDNLIETAEIPEGVTEISGTFGKLKKLRSVKLPQSLEHIGGGSFYKCESLEKIDIPDNVSEIGFDAFQSCVSLSEVMLPENCKVCSKAFADCTALENVDLPENAVYEDMAFRDTPFEAKEPYFILNKTLQKCNTRGKVVIPDNVTRIGQDAFKGSNVTELIIPDSVAEIAGYAFSGCESLEKITLPDSTEKLPEGCFYGCTSIKEFDFPESLAEIGERAFSQSGLVSVNIPHSVKVIGANAFHMCNNITSLEYPADTKVDNGAFAYCASLKELSFEEGVSELPDFCFRNCTALTQIQLPDSIKLIGIGCFACCTELKTAELCISIDGYGDNMEYHAEEYTYGWFSGCDNLQYVFLSDNTEMADYRSLMAGTKLKGVYVLGNIEGYMSGSRNTNTEYYKKNPVYIYSEKDVSTALMYMTGAQYRHVSSREEAEELMGLNQ